MTYQDLCQTYSDAFKEYHSVRPHGFLNDLSVEQMESAIEMYQEWVQQDLELARADEDKSINACMDHGAPDIDTAMRWLEQANIHAEWA